jgi:hypothetical protein
VRSLPLQTAANFPANHQPILTVVVDTEEEFDWSLPFSREATATTNISAQPMMHTEIFDRFGMIPTYVVDWPVASSPSAVRALSELQRRGACEIGAHLHPWVTPPDVEQLSAFNSYHGNLPADLEFDKLQRLTERITMAFGQRPRVFKAGRYGLGENTPEMLAKLGYDIDASVVPFTSLQNDGGPDFTGFSPEPFWFKANDHRMLELPTTAGFSGVFNRFGNKIFPLTQTSLGKAIKLGGITSRLGLLERIRLTPEGHTLAELIRLADSLLAQGCKVMTLSYHSSSLAPGNTQYVRSNADLESFKETTRKFLQHFESQLGGVMKSTHELHSIFTESAHSK